MGKDNSEYIGMNFNCPNCGKMIVYYLKDEDDGKPIICDKCHGDFSDNKDFRAAMLRLRETSSQLGEI